MKKLKSTKKINRSLAVSIILFLIVAGIALYIVLSKGKVLNVNLVTALEENSQNTITQTIEVESDKEFISLSDKEEANLTVKIDEEETTDDLEFISSDEDIAVVDEDGVVTPKGVGTVTITAKRGDLTATTDIYVIKPIKTMTLTMTSQSIKVGMNYN